MKVLEIRTMKITKININEEDNIPTTIQPIVASVLNKIIQLVIKPKHIEKLVHTKVSFDK